MNFYEILWWLTSGLEIATDFYSGLGENLQSPTWWFKILKPLMVKQQKHTKTGIQPTTIWGKSGLIKSLNMNYHPSPKPGLALDLFIFGGVHEGNSGDSMLRIWLWKCGGNRSTSLGWSSTFPLKIGENRGTMPERPINCPFWVSAGTPTP